MRDEEQPGTGEPLWRRIVWLLVLLLAAWGTMNLSHELGHVLGGLAGGGRLVEADLRPWALPYSLFSPDPFPLLTLWAGPVLGVLIPLAAALAIRRSAAWFLADFCLLANGGYLALAWWSGDIYLDTPRLLAAGAPPWTIAVFIAATLPPGFLRFRQRCREVLGGGRTNAKA